MDRNDRKDQKDWKDRLYQNDPKMPMVEKNWKYGKDQLNQKERLDRSDLIYRIDRKD